MKKAFGVSGLLIVIMIIIIVLFLGNKSGYNPVKKIQSEKSQLELQKNTIEQRLKDLEDAKELHDKAMELQNNEDY